MVLRALGSVAFLSLGLGLAACAGQGGGGGGDDDDDGMSTRPDAGDFVADDGAVVGETTMIDNLEDGDAEILPILGRLGYWYTFNDETMGGTQTPASGGDFTPEASGANDSSFSARTTGKGFKTWGAGMGFDLAYPGEPAMGQPPVKGKYDASQYAGIAFEAKGNVTIRFQVMSSGTVSMTEGGECPPSTVEGKECDDGHGKAIALGSSWKTYEIPFKDLKQGGWGLPVQFDATKVTGLLFLVQQNLDFDYSIDNVRFYTE
jgi:hypothetical protein